ncbi:hypothetical protein, partial [Leuconostoc mesenteroides]|uniref:hypothetical protein n=1 Tax=Leuconostoc mesenteroides TaxID=1245 RepID=UPI00235E1625
QRKNQSCQSKNKSCLISSALDKKHSELLTYEQTTEIIWLDSRKCTVYTGKIGNCRFIAWSLYVQAALTINDRNALTMAINERL